MKKFFFENRINYLFLFISFLCLIGTIGVENISFQSIKWLHNRDDIAAPHFGWYFFKNDIWRFPLGSNPNYGDGIGNSIVFIDSVPILSLIFKLFRSFLPEPFQYVSFLYFICFYLQLFFSYKILKKFTNSDLYSVIGSLFFIIAPIFIWTSQLSPGLSNQWILLLALYVALIQKINKSKLSWFFLIILSSLINFYFMITIIAVYSLLRIFNLKFKREIFFKFIKDFFILTTLILFILYTVGYFEVRMVDTLALGFGRDKLNLLSIFDPVNNIDDIRWSWFLPDIKLHPFEETKGFNYLGLGQIIMLIFALTLFFKRFIYYFRERSHFQPILT